MKFCVNCGSQLPNDAAFCNQCGAQQPFGAPNTSAPQNQNKKDDIYDLATGKLNSLTGGNGSVRINLKILFSEVFKHHSSEEAERIFIAGTHYTTPKMEEVSENLSKPWLFSRVLAYFMLVFAILIMAAYIFGGQLAVPGLMLVAALAVPFSAVVFYFECNAFKNISIFTVIKIYFIGGAVSLLATMILYQFALYSDDNSISLWSALVIGAVEEIGKMAIVYYFINRLQNNFILNGILIGGAVGAGFASFETAGYIVYSGNEYLYTAIIRALTAIGGHLVWAAITGGALMLVKKYGQQLDSSEIFSSRFLSFFGMSIVLHALWDWTLPFEIPKMIILIVIAWIILFVLMNAGINQIRSIKTH